MKLDEKYFIPFLAVVAIVAALLIVFFTVNSREGKERAFQKSMVTQDSLKFAQMPAIQGSDSLSVQEFSGKYVIVDFWSTWSASFSEQAHKQLEELDKNYPGKLEIIAAVVEDKSENIQEYISRYNYPFHFVDGTRVFNRFDVPGVPTQLVYAPGGKLRSIFTGRADAARMDSLTTIINNEQ